MINRCKLAIIGGTGIYSLLGLSNEQIHNIKTPFGKPSSPIVTGILDGHSIAFLARHGVNHQINPSEINYRANIYALKMIGAERIISISACGSLRDDYAPGHIVIPDQIFDNTKGRANSFFEKGLVAHISVANPFCPELSAKLVEAIRRTGAIAHQGGTFITVEGPRFSTKAESSVYRSLGMSVIGMTSCPEAFLAREAEICYAVMAHVTDYDVWHSDIAPVNVETVTKVLSHNTSIAQKAIHNLLESLEKASACECQSALSSALITNPAAIPLKTRKKIYLFLKKYTDKNAS